MINIWQDIPRMVEVVPEGRRPTAYVEHMTVSEKHTLLMNIMALQGDPMPTTPPGTYCKLVTIEKDNPENVDAEGRVIMMSDTYMERETNREFLEAAEGDVLIAGLGIGMIVVAACRKPEVRSVTVLELNQDVIDLVEPPVRKFLGDDANKFAVHQCDVFQYIPPKGSRYDTIYFDIWPRRSTDNLSEMAKLHRRYGRYKRSHDSWMRSWYRDELLEKRKEEKRTEAAFRDLAEIMRIFL